MSAAWRNVIQRPRNGGGVVVRLRSVVPISYRQTNPKSCSQRPIFCVWLPGPAALANRLDSSGGQRGKFSTSGRTALSGGPQGEDPIDQSRYWYKDLPRRAGLREPPLKTSHSADASNTVARTNKTSSSLVVQNPPPVAMALCRSRPSGTAPESRAVLRTPPAD